MFTKIFSRSFLLSLLANLHKSSIKNQQKTFLRSVGYDRGQVANISQDQVDGVLACITLRQTGLVCVVVNGWGQKRCFAVLRWGRTIEGPQIKDHWGKRWWGLTCGLTPQKQGWVEAKKLDFVQNFKSKHGQKIDSPNPVFSRSYKHTKCILTSHNVGDALFCNAFIECYSSF